MDFLAQLADPDCNDREWYVLSIAASIPETGRLTP